LFGVDQQETTNAQKANVQQDGKETDLESTFEGMMGRVLLVLALTISVVGAAAAQQLDQRDLYNEMIRNTAIGQSQQRSFSARPNPLGGYDYSNGLSSRRNPMGGQDFSNGVSCQPGPLGGYSCR
jgi:hypothetical protein